MPPRSAENRISGHFQVVFLSLFIGLKMCSCCFRDVSHLCLARSLGTPPVPIFSVGPSSTVHLPRQAFCCFIWHCLCNRGETPAPSPPPQHQRVPPDPPRGVPHRLPVPQPHRRLPPHAVLQQPGVCPRRGANPYADWIRRKFDGSVLEGRCPINDQAGWVAGGGPFGPGFCV